MLQREVAQGRHVGFAEAAASASKRYVQEEVQVPPTGGSCLTQKSSRRSLLPRSCSQFLGLPRLVFEMLFLVVGNDLVNIHVVSGGDIER